MGSAWVLSPLHQFPSLLPPLGASKIQVVTWVDIPVNKDSNDYMLAPVLCIAGVFPHTLLFFLEEGQHKTMVQIKSIIYSRNISCSYNL